MLSHDEMIGLQAEKGELIEAEKFNSNKSFVLHLIHQKAYENASELTEGKKVLDLGCNTGYGSNIIKNSCKEIIGVDVSEKAIKMAQDLYVNKGIEYKLIDGKQLPFSENSFDVVVSFQVIEHIIEHEEYLKEIQRVLVPGGKVIFTTPNRMIRLYPGMKPWNDFHVKEYDSAELKTLLDGFFNSIEILGLFGNDPLYTTELSRVGQIRERARRKQDDSLNPVIKGAWLLALNLKASIKKRLAGQPEVFQGKYSTKDLYYKTSNLEGALDLMAICSNNKTA